MRRGLIFLILLVTTACAPAQKNVTTVPELAPPPAAVEETRPEPDSLFDPAGAQYLFADNRARRVGDIVLINIVENSQAKQTADTNTNRDSSIDLGVESFFGKSSMHAIPLGILAGNSKGIGPKGEVGSTPIVKAQSKSEFEGTGETTRESNVTATIAARVVRDYPNGILQVEGGREIRVNGETQIIVLRGLIRSRDIGPDNTITSNHLADARIEYYGQGILADKQKPGWLTRILDNVWPF